MEMRREFSFGNLIEDTQDNTDLPLPPESAHLQKEIPQQLEQTQDQTGEPQEVIQNNLAAHDQSKVQDKRQSNLGNDMIKIDEKTGELILYDTNSGKLASKPKKKTATQNEAKPQLQDPRNLQQQQYQQQAPSNHERPYQLPPNHPYYAQYQQGSPYQQYSQPPQQPGMPPQQLGMPPQSYSPYSQPLSQPPYPGQPPQQYPPDGLPYDQYQRPHYAQQYQQQRPYLPNQQNPPQNQQYPNRQVSSGGQGAQYQKGYQQAAESIQQDFQRDQLSENNSTNSNKMSDTVKSMTDSMKNVSLHNRDKMVSKDSSQVSKANSEKNVSFQEVSLTQDLNQEGEKVGPGRATDEKGGQESQDLNRSALGDAVNSNVQSTTSSSKEDSFKNEVLKSKNEALKVNTIPQHSQGGGAAGGRGDRSAFLQSRDSSNKQIYSNHSSVYVSESDSEQRHEHSRHNSYNSLSQYYQQQQQQIPPQHQSQGPGQAGQYEGGFEGSTPSLRLRVNPYQHGRSSTPFGESPRHYQPQPYSPSVRTQPPQSYLNSNQSYFQRPPQNYYSPQQPDYSGLNTARSSQYNMAFDQINSEFDRYQSDRQQTGRSSSMFKKPNIPNFYRHQQGDSDSALSSRGEFLKTYKLQDKEKHYQSQTEKHMDQQMKFIQTQHKRIKELQEKYNGAQDDIQTMMSIISTVAKIMQERDDQSELIQQEFQEITELAKKWEKSAKVKRSSTKNEIAKMLPQIRKNVQMFRSKRDGDLQQQISEKIEVAKLIAKSYLSKKQDNGSSSQKYVN